METHEIEDSTLAAISYLVGGFFKSGVDDCNVIGRLSHYRLFLRKNAGQDYYQVALVSDEAVSVTTIRVEEEEGADEFHVYTSDEPNFDAQLFAEQVEEACGIMDRLDTVTNADEFLSAIFEGGDASEEE